MKPQTKKIALVLCIEIIFLSITGVIGAYTLGKTDKCLLIQGTVRDAVSGKPISGALVRDYHDGCGNQHAFTDSAGHYQYLALSENHKLIVEAPWHRTAVQSFKTNFFSKDTEKVVDFKLTEE